MTALATPADVRTFLGLTAGLDEALLTTLCAAASAFVLSYLGHVAFAATTVTENYNGTGSDTLVPDGSPITAVSAVSVDGVSIAVAASVTDSGFLFDRRGIYLRGYRFTRGRLNVAISYTYGYAAVLDDVKQVVVEMVAEKYQRRLRMGISSKTIGQESISYNTSDLSPTNKVVLNEYRTRFLTQ